MPSIKPKAKARRGIVPAAEPSRVRMHWTCDACPKYAVVYLTESERHRVSMILPSLRDLPDYDKSPVAFEAMATDHVAVCLPDVTRILELLHSFGFPLIVVKGLPKPFPAIATPLDGNVDAAAVKPHVAAFVGLFGLGCKLGGFAYATENRGLILRAVTPLLSEKGKASSQGFDSDLCWHNDNANHFMLNEAGFSPGKAFMNPVQGFVAINTRPDVPMELVSLDDVLFQLEERFGKGVRDDLFDSGFGVLWPDSHVLARQVAAKNVPLLVNDESGNVHSRFHGSNVFAIDERCGRALEIFREVLSATTSIVEIDSDPGDLIVYSNTRMMHRRRAFEPRFDGSDRYFVRVYLAPLRAFNSSRVVA